MQIYQVSLGNSFPVVLGCLENGTVALLKPNGIRFNTIIDYPPTPDGVGGFFTETGVCLYQDSPEINQSLRYNTAYNYKEIPLLLAWLKQQNLQMPQ